MTVKLDFNNDFTYFLNNAGFHDPVHIVTESEDITCSAVLLAQHSATLRDAIKDDNELILTENKHVSECLSVLYGGSVMITKENFQDILNFMVAFDIPAAQKQVLDWMIETRWTLDNSRLLINGSMAAANACGNGSQQCTDSEESLKEQIYQPCRMFFGKHLLTMIRPKGNDSRYHNLNSAMRYVISEVKDKKELLVLLMHQDLIPDYLSSIIALMDETSYNIFLNSLDRPEISNAMSLSTRTQFEELFEKIEDFDNLTMKEYKQLNKYKMKIHDKMAVVQSLKTMKKRGSLHSCWKVFDADGMSQLSTAFPNKSDQICVIECLLSWVAANKSSNDLDAIENILAKAIGILSEQPENISFQIYCVNYVQFILSNLIGPYQFHSISEVPFDRTILQLELIDVTLREVICLSFIGTGIKSFSEVKFSVKLFQDRIPEVTCVPIIGSYTLHVYASKIDLDLKSRIDYRVESKSPTRVPLYSEPGKAFNIIKQYPYSSDEHTEQKGSDLYNYSSDDDNIIDYEERERSLMRFDIFCIGV